MYVIDSYKDKSGWLIAGGVVLLLLIIFLVWLFWYYWGSSTISVSQQSFTVRSDKSAHIKPCNGYVQRLAFCAKEDADVTVTIHLQSGGTIQKDLSLTADTVYWWQLNLDEYPNFSSVSISSSATVDVIAEVVSTNLCDCKKSCSTSCSTDKCSTSKCGRKC